MRNLKKILAMALTVLMVVGSFAMTATAAFDDVTDYQEAIEVMAALGIAAGKSETEFAPDDDVTREEMALWIAKIMTGKVAADYVTNNFLGAVENLTAFADLDEDNYVGAINYATNNGIIVGTSATTFEPAEAIKIQDVFAMVVRMLGYGSTAMNNNYPWSFIDKAISLGLDADLPADYSNEAVASRGETMQILYNALTALKSDGSTLGYDFFGLEKATVVITGTADGNMYTGADLVTKTVDGEDYVAFSVLNANGTVATDKATYYTLKSNFGIEGNANAYVGNSYVVRTVDGFASFLTVEANGYEVVQQDAIVGASSDAAPANGYVTVDGTSYKLVNSYSDFIANNDTEIIFMKANGKRTEVYDVASYVMDENLNIIGEDGNILLYWKSTQGSGNTYANLNGMYLFEYAKDSNGEPLYIQPNEYIWSLAKKVSVNSTTSEGFAAIENSYKEIEKYDAYSDTVLYDDDNDGNYDRAVYYQYEFGRLVSGNKVYKDGTGYEVIRIQNATNYAKEDTRVANYWKYLDTRAASTSSVEMLKSLAPSAANIYTVDGEKLTFADINNKYIIFTYIPLYKTIIVKDILEEQTGLVTGINLQANTITLNGFGANLLTGVVAGETYGLGNAKLLGATNAEVKAFGGELLTNIIGKNINYVEKDGNVLAVFNAIDDAKHMVYVGKSVGYTTMGYENILAFYNAASSKIATTQSVVTINAVNNYWYSGLYASSTVDFVEGDLLVANKDALGNYDVRKIAPVSGKDGETKYIKAAKNSKIYVENNVVYAESDVVYEADGKTVKEASASIGFTPFQANASTVWIVYTNGKFTTYTGLPTAGAYISLPVGAEVFYESTENFVYVKGGAFGTNFTTNSYDPWGNNVQNNTIIYVSQDTMASGIYSNVVNYGTGVLSGMGYSYKYAVDLINGKYVDIATLYNNNIVTAGKFYVVENGIVVREATTADGVAATNLVYADNDSAWKTVIFNDTNKDGLVDVDNELKTVNNIFPSVFVDEGIDGMYYSNTALIDVLDYFDSNANSSVYYTKCAGFAAGYDSIKNADGLYDFVEVYYYNGSAYPAYKSAPVFIQKSTSAVKTAAAYEAPAAPETHNVQIALFVQGNEAWTPLAVKETADKDVKVFEGIAWNNNVILGDQISIKRASENALDMAVVKMELAEAEGAAEDDYIVIAIAKSYEAKYAVHLTYTIQSSADDETLADAGLMSVAVEPISVVTANTDIAMNYNYYVINVTEAMEAYNADADANNIYLNIGVEPANK